MSYIANQLNNTQSREYPELKPLLEEASKPTAYPMHALPEILREAAMEVATIGKLGEVMAVNTGLAVMAHLTQPRINAIHPSTRQIMPTSLNILSLADSGARKSTARRYFFKAIGDDERDKYLAFEKEKAQRASEAENAKKPKEIAASLHALRELENPRTLIDGGTYEGLQGLFIRGAYALSWDTDEGGQFFGGYSMKSETRTNALGGLTKLFDSGNGSRTVSRSNAEGSGIYQNRRLSMHLMAQEITVREALKDPIMKGQGFLPRFLLGVPESLEGTRQVDPEELVKKNQSLTL